MASAPPFIAHLQGVVRELGGRCLLTKVGDVLKRQGYTFQGQLITHLASKPQLVCFRLGAALITEFIFLQFRLSKHNGADVVELLPGQPPAAAFPAARKACCYWKRTGVCDYGEKCEFLHDKSVPGCSKGSACTYGHNSIIPSGLHSALKNAIQGLAVNERVYLERFASQHPELKKGLQNFAQENLLSGWISVIEVHFQDIAVVHRTIPSQPNLWQISAVSKLAPQPVVSLPTLPATQSPASTASLAPAPSAPVTAVPSNSNVRLVQTSEGALLPVSIHLSLSTDCRQAVLEVQRSPRIAIDCEGVSLGKEGRLTLIQIATDTGAAYLFDVIQLCSDPASRDSFIVQMRATLEDNKAVKILHDCRQDVAALHFQFGVTIKNVVDTQVLYGLLVDMERYGIKGEQSDMIVDRKRRIGLNKLLAIASFPLNPLKSAMEQQMQANEKLWEQRPLSRDMIDYAVADVSQLLALEEWLQTRLRHVLALATHKLSTANSMWYINRSGSDEEEHAPPIGIDLLLRIDPTTHTVSYEEFTARTEATKAPSPPAVNTDHWSLLPVIPEPLKSRLLQLNNGNLMEILLTSYRQPILRFSNGIPEHDLDLPGDLNLIPDAVNLLLGDRQEAHVFSSDNRAGLPGALHRISATRDRTGAIIALTYRIGRHMPGSAELIRDLVAMICKQQSLLLLGPPGVGKTTLLRDITRLLANDLGRRVVVVDTSNEIAGDHARPHHCIGRAHRMPVADRYRQHEVLVEAVQNQNPEVIVVDEIGTAEEVNAARTITQRGVGMVGTAHGNSIHSIMKNPTLRPLIGGVHAVTLSASEAKSRNPDGAIHKTQLERAGAPTFEVIVELVSKNRCRIYRNVSKVVDDLLLGQALVVEERWKENDQAFARFCKTKPNTRESSIKPPPENWFEELQRELGPANGT